MRGKYGKAFNFPTHSFMKFSSHILALLFSIAFTLQAQSAIQYKMVVAQDGSGDYTTIQSAIDATKAFPDKRITIHIKNGIYREKVHIPAWNNKLSLFGEDAEKTIITYDDFFKKIDRGRNSTFMTYTVLVEADDFYAENLTIENTAGKVGQAVALHVEGNRCVFNKCQILGDQDTLYIDGEQSNQYFTQCLIAGTTDFIFGGSTALFSQCTINSKSNSYITAASTYEGKAFGLVFMDCELVANPEAKKVYLGRPWRNYAQTVFIRCNMGEHIRPEGWHNWRKEEAETTAFYAEFANTGSSADVTNRVAWSHQLKKKQAKKYTSVNILGNWVSPYLAIH